MSTPLMNFLHSRRVVKGTPEYVNWNLTGIAKGIDVGSYWVKDEDYDSFLNLFHDHVFGRRPMPSSLLERHREEGPLLVDLDLRYPGGGSLTRKFRPNDIKKFIAEYAAAMIYFSRLEDLPKDLDFYIKTKPLPEMDGPKHKDGVHIECADIYTVPKYQYAIRGFLLQQNTTKRLFEMGGNINSQVETFDVAVIHNNNWFLYGSCKPNKAQYRVDKIWRLSISDIRESLDGGDPADFNELVEIVEELLTNVEVPSDTKSLLKHLSIRKNIKATKMQIRPIRAAEWEELMIGWGSGKKDLDRSVPAHKNTIEFNNEDEEDRRSADELIVTEPEDTTRVTSATTEEDIKLAHRLARECLNAERRCGDYHDWVNLAICLKNIANTEEAFTIWCELTRRVNITHKKAHMADAELRAKWNLIRIDGSKKLGIGSLHHWAEEDNPDRRRSILSEHYTQWIISYASNTHVSIAEFVCKLYRHEFRCCKGAARGQFEWYQYVGHHWKRLVNHTELRARLSGRVKDEYIEAWRKLGKKANEMSASAEAQEGIEEKRKMLRGIERNLEMAPFKDSVMRECQEKFEDPTFLKKLNADPYLLGVTNGVLELQYYENEARTGRPHVRFRDGRPDDYVSFQMGGEDDDSILYEPYDATAPEQVALAEFFQKIYPDPVLREYVITLYASCLEGTNKEQKFYVPQGVGSNGKSMEEMLMEQTFGDYGTALGTQVFTRKRPDSGAANPDIITVQKRRYIHTGEPDDDEKINTSIMKQWTGGDRIAARGLFSDQEKFSIMGKIFMSCNELPPVSKMDNGTWRRLRVIPHLSVFKDHDDPDINPSKHIYEKDLYVESKIPHWRKAFLSLLVHYYEMHYLEHGLKEPSCVLTASNKYKEENDVFTKFFEENFVRDPAAAPLLSKEVKNIWRDWKRSMGRAIDLRENAVLDRMKEKCGAGSTDKEFFGIRVLDDAPDLSGSLLRPV
jgi:P4 family phage/plasmid primase-like protien